MKIRISEMFKDADINIDLIKTKDDSGVDKDKIKQLVLNKINGQSLVTISPNIRKKNSKRYVLFAVAIVAILGSALGANAATSGKLFGALILNDENRDVAKSPNYASIKDDSIESENIEEKKPVQFNKIINESQLQSISADSVTNIPVEVDKGAFAIPQILTDNGDLIIFTKSDESGWYLKKGEKISIEFKLNLTINSNSDPIGEIMQIGYIKNGQLIEGVSAKEKEFSYTITADEEGEYYFYTENYSAGNVIIETGTIK